MQYDSAGGIQRWRSTSSLWAWRPRAHWSCWKYGSPSLSARAYGRLFRRALAFFFVLLAGRSTVCAQPVPRKLVVLNASAAGLDEGAREHIDAVLFTTLLKLRRFATVEASPVPFEDVQLALGCADDENACLTMIAQQLDTRELLVRRLVAQPDGSLTLTLTAYGAAPTGEGQGQADATPHSSTAHAELTWSQLRAPEEVVPSLLAEIYPSPVAPAPAAAAVVQPLEVRETPPESTSRHAPVKRSRRALKVAWTLGALGGGLLAAGIATGALARSSEQQYADIAIEEMVDVDRAHKLLDRTERRARVANILFGVGGVVASAGLASAVWHWLSVRTDTASVALRMEPTRAGVMLALDGSWQGGF